MKAYRGDDQGNYVLSRVRKNLLLQKKGEGGMKLFTINFRPQ